MSVQALTWVLDHSPAIGGDRLVLISLANHADRDGCGSYPTVPTIALETRMGDRAVQYALRSLEHGFEGSGKAIRREGVGPNRATLWRVLMDAQARTFKGLPRPAKGADLAPTETAPEGANPVSDFAPSGVQNPTALNARGGSSEPSFNRQEHPLTPIAGDGGAPLDTVPPDRPDSGRRRDLEPWRAQLAAWVEAHPPDPSLQPLLEVLLDELRVVVDPGTFAIWLDPLHVHAASDELLVLGGPEAQISWLDGKWLALLTEAAERQEPVREVRIIGCECDPAAQAADRRVA